MLYNQKATKHQVASLVTIKIIILVLFFSCASTKTKQNQKHIQKAIFEITNQHFGTLIEHSKKRHVWINNKVHKEFELGKFDSIDFVKITQLVQ